MVLGLRGGSGEVVALPLEFGELQARLRHGQLVPLLRDGSWLAADVSSSRTAAQEGLRDALRLGAQALSHDPAQLGGQLVGRLAGTSLAELQPLVAQAHAWRDTTWLCPDAASLAPPGGALLAQFTCNEDGATAVAFTRDGRVLTGFEDGSLRLGDVWAGTSVPGFKTYRQR